MDIFEIWKNWVQIRYPLRGALYLKIDQIVQNDPQLNSSYDYVVCRSIEEYEKSQNGRSCREKMVARADMLRGHNCCGEVLV